VVIGEVAVADVPTIAMTSRLGDIAYSYGETALGGKRALVVMIADETGGLISVRSAIR
jgi:hypothetical protein